MEEAWVGVVVIRAIAVADGVRRTEGDGSPGADDVVGRFPLGTIARSVFA